MHKILYYTFVKLLQIKRSTWVQAYKDNQLQIYDFSDLVAVIMMQTY